MSTSIDAVIAIGAAVFSPVKKYGRQVGSITFVYIVKVFAAYEYISSCFSRSTDLNPASIFAATG